MREKSFLNEYAVTVEVHAPLRNASSNIEKKKAKRNHPSIHPTLIIRSMNVTVWNQIRTSHVDWRIILLQNVQNRKL